MFQSLDGFVTPILNKPKPKVEPPKEEKKAEQKNQQNAQNQNSQSQNDMDVDSAAAEEQQQ